MAKLITGGAAALFLLAFLCSPLQSALPTADGEGHHHLIADHHDHHHDRAAADGGGHDHEAPPASDADVSKGSDHSHPATPGALVAVKLRLSKRIGDVMHREITLSPRAPSAPVPRLNRPPQAPTVSA